MHFQVSRILHAGYIFEYCGFRIVFDPVLTNPFSHNCYAYPSIKFLDSQLSQINVDAVFISHVHDDHLCLESLNKIDKNIPIYLYTTDDLYLEFIQKIGFKKVSRLFVDNPVEISADIKITPKLALDADVDTLFHIQLGSFHILNVVDSWIDPHALDALAQIQSWDLILWPFQTMRELQVLDPKHASTQKEIPVEWAEQLKILSPRYIVPSSCQFIHEDWSWYNHQLFPISYVDFKNWCKVQIPQSYYLRIDPGKSFQISKRTVESAKSLSFIKSLSSEIVDYQYQPELTIPSVGEIAQKLSSLSADQMNQIKNYCDIDLRTAFDQLEIKDSKFCWRLIVWANKIEKTIYEFSYGANQVPTWQTEIAIQKLYSALYTGETLTSLYLRINNCDFSESIELQNQEKDILMDPLIQILFQNQSHRYHLNQLNKLGVVRKQL